MYSGTTLTKFSGRLLGGHQKIDRVARRHLDLLLPGAAFPPIRQILHFEGGNGPDAIKRKSPAVDEPWHYYQPFDASDTVLPDIIDHHYRELVASLRTGNNVKASFEAAWLAHAIVDGLTPAHHYPYEEKLIELRGGEGIDSRTTIKGKLVLPGDTRRGQLKNNWKMWGPKGLMTTHGAFEWGVATLIAPLKLNNALPRHEDITTVQEHGIVDYFRMIAKEVAVMDLYTKFYRRGWSPRLARKVRGQLAPLIVRTVTLAWYAAQRDAQTVVKR
jgi:hypothetical protein